MPDFEAIARQLGSRPDGSPRPVGGGCIHACYRWGSVFLKTNSAAHEATFQAEAECLAAIAATGTIRVPEVIGRACSDGGSFLALEFLDLRESGDESRLGEELAALHQHGASYFGFGSDNFIGATPQENGRMSSWTEFFRQRRMRPLLDRLARNGFSPAGSETFLERLDDLLPADDPPASLLHGDLWAGNRAYLPDGTPVLFDPASYYGHAACDLAMTTLFGGFGRRFSDAYRHHASAAFDAPELYDLYNLYHLLNHALLFGGHYGDLAAAAIRRFSK